MIIYKCPECGKIIHPEAIATIPPTTIYHCWYCGYHKEEKQELIIKEIKDGKNDNN